MDTGWFYIFDIGGSAMINIREGKHFIVGHWSLTAALLLSLNLLLGMSFGHGLQKAKQLKFYFSVISGIIELVYD